MDINEDEGKQKGQQGQNQQVDLLGTAMNAVNKVRREQAQNKVTELVKKKLEADKAVRLIEAEIEGVINDYNKGL